MKGDFIMGLELGQYIRNLRKEKKLSVKELSIQSEVSKSYIDYIESGAREPQPEILAKIAVVLDIHLSTLINIQKKEQLIIAINKLKTQHRSKNEEDEIRSVARTGDGNLSIDDKALAQVLEAFRDADNTKKIADYIVNPDLRAMVKAGANLSDEDLTKIRKVMESLYPDAFNT